MSAVELAIEKLRRARERLPPEDLTPDLDDLLGALEMYEAAQAELQQAARGAAPPPGQYWGADGAAANPHLFRGLVHLLAALTRVMNVPLAAPITPELQDLLISALGVRPLLCHARLPRSACPSLSALPVHPACSLWPAARERRCVSRRPARGNPCPALPQCRCWQPP